MFVACLDTLCRQLQGATEESHKIPQDGRCTTFKTPSYRSYSLLVLITFIKSDHCTTLSLFFSLVFIIIFLSSSVLCSYLFSLSLLSVDHCLINVHILSSTKYDFHLHLQGRKKKHTHTHGVELRYPDKSFDLARKPISSNTVRQETSKVTTDSHFQMLLK